MYSLLVRQYPFPDVSTSTGLGLRGAKAPLKAPPAANANQHQRPSETSFAAAGQQESRTPAAEHRSRRDPWPDLTWLTDVLHLTGRRPIATDQPKRVREKCKTKRPQAKNKKSIERGGRFASSQGEGCGRGWNPISHQQAHTHYLLGITRHALH